MTTRTITAGKRDKRLRIEQGTRAQGATGEETLTWSSKAVVWAAVETLTGRELEHARQTVATATHQATFPYVKGITPKMRFRYKGRLFYIEHVNDRDLAQVELVCLCREEL